MIHTTHFLLLESCFCIWCPIHKISWLGDSIKKIFESCRSFTGFPESLKYYVSGFEWSPRYQIPVNLLPWHLPGWKVLLPGPESKKRDFIFEALALTHVSLRLMLVKSGTPVLVLKPSAFVKSCLDTFCLPTFLRSCVPAFMHSCIHAFLPSCLSPFLCACVPLFVFLSFEV